MNKKAFLEETYNSAFEDELEKIALINPSKLLKSKIGLKTKVGLAKALKSGEERAFNKMLKNTNLISNKKKQGFSMAEKQFNRRNLLSQELEKQYNHQKFYDLGKL